MESLFLWLLSFFTLLFVMAILGYQMMCLTDLELDNINAYDSARRINKSVMLEMIGQAVACFLFLVSGRWFMFLLSLPYLCYNFKLYRMRKHLVDVTEIYNHLEHERNRRLIKFGYMCIIVVLFLFWVIWSVAENFER
uniref:Cornichon family protein n=1 Tax=Kalanchoe fedtschenkoi TaxID=63787 RepID=A0A7N0ZQT7_KALFE